MTLNKKKETLNSKAVSNGFTVDLEDSKSVWVDEGGKSRAFFCKRNPVRVNMEVLSELKKAAKRYADENVRLCLHGNKNASFHDMIILVHKGQYYRPHKHHNKDESFNIKEGAIAVFVFDDTGKVIDACVLCEQENFLYRIGVNFYHAIIPLTDIVIYHESKPGPFTGEGDSIYPTWAPDGNDPEKAKTFTDNLISLLDPT